MDHTLYNATLTNHQSGMSCSCKVTCSNGTLLIYPDDGSGLQSWSLSASVPLQSGHDVWRIARGSWELSLTGKDAQGLLFRIHQDETAVRKASFPAGKLLLIALAGLLITAGIIYAVYASLPYIASRAADAVPPEYEVQLGDAMAVSVMQQYAGAGNDSLDILLNAFAKEIDFGTAYPVRVHAIRSGEINAFAVPGGHIFIYTGLLEKMTDYSELAALLGHEVSHVAKRHSLRSIFSKATAGLLLSSVFGDSGGLGSWAVGQADELKQLHYSRELETEADLHGIAIMKKNAIDPEGMLRLLQILDTESVEAPAMMKYLSTHPETEERIASVRAELTERSGFSEDAELAGRFRAIKAWLAK